MGTTNTYVNDHEKGFCQETLTKMKPINRMLSQETLTKQRFVVQLRVLLVNFIKKIMQVGIINIHQ